MTIDKLKQYRSLKREITELQKDISRDQNRLTQCIEICTEIVVFIDNINDSLTRQIFEYKYIIGRYHVSFRQVAEKIGNGNKASGMRMHIIRYLQKNMVS